MIPGQLASCTALRFLANGVKEGASAVGPMSKTFNALGSAHTQARA